MIGNNKLLLNQATMKIIVQEWLERNLVTCNSEVDFVSENHDLDFEIILKEKETIKISEFKGKKRTLTNEEYCDDHECG